MGTYILDPNGVATDSGDVLIVGTATTIDRALSKFERDPLDPDLIPYIASSGTESSCILDAQSFLKSPVSTVTDVVAHIYSETNDASGQVDIEIRVGPSIKATGTLGPGVYAATWDTVTWVSGDISQQDVHDLRIRLRWDESDTFIYALYLEVTTTEGALTFVPAVSTNSPQAEQRWRPRIKPGAFWI